MSDTPNDPMGILLPKQAITLPYLVTMQMQFKVEAKSAQQAEFAVMRGISMNAIIVGGLLTQGCVAEHMTQQVMDQIAQLAKEQGVNLNG